MVSIVLINTAIPLQSAWNLPVKKLKGQSDVVRRFAFLCDYLLCSVDGLRGLALQGHKKPDPRWLNGGFSQEEEEAMHAQGNVRTGA